MLTRYTKVRTLDDALLEPLIDKWDFYTAITGKDWWSEGMGIGNVHPFQIQKKDVDKIYELVLTFKRTYARPGVSTEQYYLKSCEEVKAAYNSNDFDSFKEAIRRLLVSIACD